MENGFYAHLHTHTIFSILDGMIDPKLLATQCTTLGYSAAAITDHGNMYGSYKFYKAMNAVNVKPIIGCEIYLSSGNAKVRDKNETRYHLTLLAKNRVGYLELINVVTWAHVNGFYHRPRADFGVLKKYLKSNNVIALSGCVAGELARIASTGNDALFIKSYEKYHDLFGDDFYLEVMDSTRPEQIYVNEFFKKMADQHGLKLVATNDCHYLREEDKKSHDCLLAIHSRSLLNDPKAFRLSENCYWFKSKEEMNTGMAQYQSALSNTKVISDMIEPDYFGKKKIHIPRSTKNKSDNEYEILRDKLRKRIKNYFTLNDITEQNKYYDRIKMELEIIKKHNIASYFNILSNISQMMLSKDIALGAGRGSAAGCLVAHVLGITNVDPIKYDLIFERFINDGRLSTGSMPDIDIDVQHNRREEVIQFIIDQFGRHNTSNILTFGYLKDKSAIKSAARVLGMSYDEANLLTKSIPDDFDFDDGDKVAVLQQAFPSFSEVFYYAKAIRGSIQNVGQHAAGMIVSDEVLTNIMPITAITDKQTKIVSIASQFDMKDVDDLGMLKIDVLGSTTQTLIINTIKLISARRSRRVVNLPENDKDVFEKIFCEKRTVGVFQMDSDIMRNALGKIMPTNIIELSIVNAIVRPGAKDYIDIYVENKKNQAGIKWIDDEECIKSILSETHGIIIFQEQVMAICKQYAGFTLEEADDIRRAIGKKIPAIIDSYKEKFVAGAIRLGRKMENANTIYNMFVAFGDYAFNKSHAVSYAIIAYQTAYYKYYYPAEFFISLLNLELIDGSKSPEDKQEFLKTTIGELEYFGIKIVPPNINTSHAFFYAPRGKAEFIYYGLAAIKDMGIPVAKSIITNRGSGEYVDMVDFFKKNDQKILNKKHMLALVQSGCFDSIYDNRFVLRQEADKIRVALMNSDNNQEVFDFFAQATSDEGFGLLRNLPSIDTKEETLAAELDLVGYYISGHPLDQWKKYFDKAENTIKEAMVKSPEEPVHICGCIKSIKDITTKKGDKMAFATVYDFSGEARVTIFPRTYTEICKSLKVGAVYYISGDIDEYDGKKAIVARNMSPLGMKHHNTEEEQNG